MSGSGTKYFVTGYHELELDCEIPKCDILLLHLLMTSIKFRSLLWWNFDMFLFASS